MPRPLRQLVLPLRASHGGRRAGAGRLNRSGLQAHVRRPVLDRRHPLHVTLKLEGGLPSLRRKDVFKCFREAVKTARTQGFAVAHFAILSNHVHLVLEPRRSSVGRELQSLCISFARRINRLCCRNGAVFRERYHLHVLKTPSEVRRALAYVLSNDARHRGRPSHRLAVDPFSSVFRFDNVKHLMGSRTSFEFSSWPEQMIENWLDEILKPPETWLLRRGWMRGAAAGQRRKLG